MWERSGYKRGEGATQGANLADLRAKDSVSGRCELTITQQYLRKSNWIRSGFPDGSEVKNPPANARDASSIPGSGRSPGGGKSNPLQYSCLEKVPWTEEPGRLHTVHEVAKELDLT